MHRRQLEHVLRAAAGITGEDQFVIIGSQAILGQFPNAPAELLVSVEVDIFSLRSPNNSTLIDGSIGEGSPFHQSFGYYAHGVGEETAVLPDGWKDRLVPIQTTSTAGTTGLCLEVHDLAVSKVAAGRPKDLDFLAVLVKYHLADIDVVRQRLATAPLDAVQKQRCLERLDRLQR